MNVGFRLQLQVASVGFAAVLVLAGCAASVPKAEHAVAPPLGSTWVMARRDSGSFGSATVQVSFKRGERKWQGEQVMTFESPGFVVLAHADGKALAFANGDKPLVSFEPDVGFDRPFEVGKSLTTNHQMTIPGRPQKVPLQVTQKVEAYEDVTVPAGTFKAFKIIWSESIGNENIYWVSPELGFAVKSILVRTAKHAAGPGKRENELVSVKIQQ